MSDYNLRFSKKFVKAWQRFVGADPDGKFGTETLRLTKAFQTENNLEPDGKVGSDTLTKAAANGFIKPVNSNPNAIDTCLPESGIGFRSYNRERGGADQFGTAFTINAIIELGSKWFDLHSNCPIQIGDIARRGGGSFPPHKSHKNGRDFDVRPIRRDGKMLPVTMNDKEFDAERTEEFVRLVRANYPNALIYFNDRRFINKGLTKHCGGHHNHLHFRLK